MKGLAVKEVKSSELIVLMSMEVNPISLVFSEAQGSIGVLTRARHDWLQAKKLNMVYEGTDDDAVSNLVKHFSTTQPK